MLRLFARRLSELQKNHEREVLTVSMPNDRELKRWFCQDVLPLEAMLTRYIRRNCSDPDLNADLRQDVYAAAIEGARRGPPDSAGGYVTTIRSEARHAGKVSVRTCKTRGSPFH